ncbi:2-C-methyl-D-erythritol 4-phosphate cytidylyltransferase [Mucilaginibacter glaciei]|uniref:2-C-methyl-D-erythritol 4-phosphate cytidylyltransferase n=1 Tax=Mucilaginibacter glaciei TaxID=2772109 RepID=A0A926NUH1_9SPHI|nr:2-C-methyl-D-erythritol 4-phosphate cytidylyltransferase [Mucilaginibacter glaciei]MBD1394955.1 2-C-methyl-D-erythritol 4-phosphate cytidylyltransferase [Mucilaginibacter glaciei]
MLHPKSEILNPKSKTYAIIVAGGSGSRMQSALPKQFIELCGKPVLMHTMEAFHNSQTSPEIILVLHATYHDLWKELCNVHNFSINHKLIAGGETRFHSVKNAVDLIYDINVLIAVHDAVRPLISSAIIDESFRCAEANGTAVTAVKSRDSIRQQNGEGSTCLNRDEIYLVQTPQTFKSALLKEAYMQPYSENFTDDASVVEQAGGQITLIAGSYSNIKITFPEDITIAEALINKKSHQR